jgi:hypothetical protein
MEEPAIPPRLRVESWHAVWIVSIGSLVGQRRIV